MDPYDNYTFGPDYYEERLNDDASFDRWLNWEVDRARAMAEAVRIEESDL